MPTFLGLFFVSLVAIMSIRCFAKSRFSKAAWRAYNTYRKGVRFPATVAGDDCVAGLRRAKLSSPIRRNVWKNCFGMHAKQRRIIVSCSIEHQLNPRGGQAPALRVRRQSRCPTFRLSKNRLSASSANASVQTHFRRTCVSKMPPAVQPERR